MPVSRLEFDICLKSGESTTESKTMSRHVIKSSIQFNSLFTLVYIMCNKRKAYKFYIRVTSNCDTTLAQYTHYMLYYLR